MGKLAKLREQIFSFESFVRQLNIYIIKVIAFIQLGVHVIPFVITRNYEFLNSFKSEMGARKGKFDPQEFH